MMTPCRSFVLSQYELYSGRIALSVGYDSNLSAIYPFVFECSEGRAIGTIAMDIMVQDEREVVHIYHINAFNTDRGHGSSMMDTLCMAADQFNAPMSLTPIPCPNGTHTIPDHEMLETWYARYGFRGDTHLVREPNSRL